MALPKVVLVIDKMIQAGTQRHVLQILEHIKNYQFHVVSLEGRGGWDNNVRRLGGRLHVYSLSRLYGASGMLAIRGLRSLLNEIKPVGIESFMFTAHIASALALKKNQQIPFISSRREKILWRKFYHFKLRKMANMYVSKHIANSKAVADDIVKKEGVLENQIAILPNGLDWSLYQKKEDLNLNSSQLHFVTVASLKSVKQHRLLIEAVAMRKDKFQSIRFHFFGDGPLKEELLSQTKKREVHNNFVFHGKVEQVQSMLAQFDGAVHPALSEGLSNAVIECQGAGLAVVAFDVDGNREVVIQNKTGLLVKPQSVKDLADSLIEIVENNNKRIEMGQNARSFAEARFDVITMCEEKNKIYNEVFSC